MMSPIIKLEEQLSDLRSDHIAYKLTIENPDSKPIRLLSVKPRVPDGASLLEIKDTSLAEAYMRKAELIEELNRLLRQFLWVTSETFRQTWIERQREAFKKIFSVTGIFNLYFHLLYNYRSFQARMKREFESFAFKIASASDARSAYVRWMKNSSEHEAIRTLFEAKTEQLEHVEARMDESDRPGLTAIEAGSCFNATYVLKFARGFLEPRKYQVDFDATYLHADSGSSQSTSTATNIQISPYPFILSVVAIIAALLGVLLRGSLGSVGDPFQEMFLLANSGKLLFGPVVALIFFNVYEYTSIGKDIDISVSWRSALLIGSLCGIAQDRVLAALKALIGA
jgi:hypothetical protein